MGPDGDWINHNYLILSFDKLEELVTEGKAFRNVFPTKPEWDMGMSVSGNRHYNAGAEPPEGWVIDEEHNRIIQRNK